MSGSIQRLKRRIRSTHNLSQVTRAMQAVSASKVSKVQQQMLASREYARWTRHFLERLSSGAGEAAQEHPLLAHPTPVREVLIIVIAGDRGLCGSYNQNVVRTTLELAQQHAGQQISFVSVGKKGQDALTQLGYPVIAHFDIPRSIPDFKLAHKIAWLAMDDFTTGQAQEVYIVYTAFINILTQQTRIQRYLPLSLKTDSQVAGGFVFEPNQQDVLEEFLPRSLESELYQLLLESATSEHAARMVSMENATRNGENLVQELTLQYNKARQQRITREIIDIAGGAEALADQASQEI